MYQVDTYAQQRDRKNLCISQQLRVSLFGHVWLIRFDCE
jgi:hypothetical protein